MCETDKVEPGCLKQRGDLNRRLPSLSPRVPEAPSQAPPSPQTAVCRAVSRWTVSPRPSVRVAPAPLVPWTLSLCGVLLALIVHISFRTSSCEGRIMVSQHRYWAFSSTYFVFSLLFSLISNKVVPDLPQRNLCSLDQFPSVWWISFVLCWKKFVFLV